MVNNSRSGLKNILIDKDYCERCSISNDNWGRQGVTPFAVACYFYHGVCTLGKSPDEVHHALMTKWDSLFWRNSGISIGLWNRLFNGGALSEEEWSKILFPLVHIDTIYTSVTSPNSKVRCHPMFFGTSRLSNELLICTEEAYSKAIEQKSATKVTAYRYGLATGQTDTIQGLREETIRVILPFRFNEN